jgi:ABC-2 type transport system permease protein
MRGRVGALVRKEYRHILRDPGTLGALLVVPLFLLAMFGWAISLDVNEVPLLVRDLDRSQESRALTAAFFASGRFTRVDDTGGLAGAALDSGRAAATLELPRGFAASLGRGRAASLQVLVDGSDATRAATVIGYIEGIVLRFGSERLSLAAARSGAPAGGLAGGGASGLDLRPRVLFNEDLRSVNNLVPGLVAIIIIITAVISTALAVVREKEQGSMEQLIVSPLESWELVAGKTLPYATIGMVSATLVLGAGALLFGVTVRGSIPELALMTALFIFACLALGILISTIAPTQQIAFLASAMLTLLPTFLLSGFVFPIRNMPALIQALTWLFPTRYFIEILQALLIKGVGIASYWHQALALLVYALVAAAIASLRFSRSRGR